LTLAVAVLSVTAAGALAQNAATPLAPGLQSTDTVRALQQKLGVSADGVYGPKTRAAVRRFQRAHGLAADGVAGPQTLAALGLGAAAPKTREAADQSSTAAPDGGAAATLQRIAQCESGGNPSAVSADGTYRGKYQFDRETWRAMGGTGDPADAPEAEQNPSARATPRGRRPRWRTARGRRRAAPRCG
jgi:peptidoglycan hydrolase-like protein with peptidoglycan-binding domain